MYQPLSVQRQNSLFENQTQPSRLGLKRHNTTNLNRFGSPLSSAENKTKQSPSFGTRGGNQNSALSTLLKGRKKIVFLTKVLIQTLEITQNQYTPVLSFLLTKYMKKIVDTLKARQNFVVSQENVVDRKEQEMLKLVIKGLKEMDEKIQAQYVSSKKDLNRLVFEEYQKNDIQLRCEVQTTTINHLYFKSIIFQFVQTAMKTCPRNEQALRLVGDLIEILSFDEQQNFVLPSSPDQKKAGFGNSLKTMPLEKLQEILKNYNQIMDFADKSSF